MVGVLVGSGVIVKVGVIVFEGVELGLDVAVEVLENSLLEGVCLISSLASALLTTGGPETQEDKSMRMNELIIRIRIVFIDLTDEMDCFDYTETLNLHHLHIVQNSSTNHGNLNHTDFNSLVK